MTHNNTRPSEVAAAIDRIERGLLGFTDDTAMDTITA